jgi:hypothetical protein
MLASMNIAPRSDKALVIIRKATVEVAETCNSTASVLGGRQEGQPKCGQQEAWKMEGKKNNKSQARGCYEIDLQAKGIHLHGGDRAKEKQNCFGSCLGLILLPPPIPGQKPPRWQPPMNDKEDESPDGDGDKEEEEEEEDDDGDDDG